MINGGLGDFVKDHPMYGYTGLDRRLEVFDEVPADGLTLTVFVGCQIDGTGLLGEGSQFLNHLGAALSQLIGGLEMVVHVDGHALRGKVCDMANRSQDVKVGTEQRTNCFGLGW